MISRRQFLIASAASATCAAFPRFAILGTMDLVRFLALTLIISMLLQFTVTPSAMSSEYENISTHSQHEHHSTALLQEKSLDSYYKCHEQCNMHHNDGESNLNCSKILCTMYADLMPVVEIIFAFKLSNIHYFYTSELWNDLNFTGPKKPPRNFHQNTSGRAAL